MSNTGYPALGGLSSATMLGMYQQTRTYSKRGWYTGLTLTTTASQQVWNAAIGYATNKSVTSYSDNVMGSWIFQYGNTNRLAVSTGPSLTLNFTYDHWGNRTSQLITAGAQTAPHWSRAYNANNRLATGFGYDAAGNITSDGFHTYTYDAEGRLYSVDGATTYIYDGESNRVAVANNGTVQREFLYDFSGHLMAAIGSDAKAARANIYMDSQLIAEDAPDSARTNTPLATLLRITDQVGTVRSILDVGLNQLQTCTSLPFGDGSSCSPSAVTDMLFSDKKRDTESYLDYFGARYYSSNMGRFLSPDFNNSGDDPEAVPYADFEDPQSLNLYAYVRNNPLSRRDSTGHACDPDTVSTSASGDTVVTAGACHYDWSTLMAGVVGFGHHYIPQQVFQNFDRAGSAYRFLNKVTTGALKNPKLSNSYDKLHRALNRQTDKVLRDLERDLGKSAEDFERGDWEKLGQRLEMAGEDVQALMNGLQTLNLKPDRSGRLSRRRLKRFTRLPLKREQRPAKPPEPQQKQE